MPGSGPFGRPDPRSGLFILLLRPGPVPLGEGITWFSAYPVLPWFGIMAIGYAFGEVLRERPARVRVTALVAGGHARLRRPPCPGRLWRSGAVPVQETAAKDVMAFLNCQKYPPSLLYALMTLGPGCWCLRARRLRGGDRDAWRRASVVRRALVTLGRVPLFYYLLQWPVIHILVMIVNTLAGQSVPGAISPFDGALDLPIGLPFVYLMWAAGRGDPVRPLPLVRRA